MAAPNLKTAIISAVAATALTAGSAMADDADKNIELAQNFQGQATVTKVSTSAEPTGAPVVFKYGKGISESDLASILRGVNEKGCPATAEQAGPPNRIRAITQGENASFREPIDAAGWALDHCEPPAS